MHPALTAESIEMPFGRSDPAAPAIAELLGGAVELERGRKGPSAGFKGPHTSHQLNPAMKGALTSS